MCNKLACSLQIHLENYMVMQLAKVLRNSLSKAYRDAGNGLERAMLGQLCSPKLVSEHFLSTTPSFSSSRQREPP